MQRRRALVLCLGFVLAATAADDTFVFTSDVALIRVDAQVVDRNNRAISGLTPEDFLLRENGAVQQIRHFGTEDTPLDVLFLLDVSGSMRPHVQDLASASRSAFAALGAGDRVGIMVFDRGTRLRLPLQDRAGALRELQRLLDQESFDGGTDVTRGILDAAAYMSRDGREDARRAIVILTDDQTERGRDERSTGNALARGNIVMSALLVPDAMGTGRTTVGWPPLGGGGGLGGIILRGPRSRFPGGGGPVITRGRTSSAGTADIARASGGDSMRVDEAAALETTLLRLRQRYTLHFSLPEGVQPGQERDIDVELTADARRRYPGAEVRFRRMSQGEGTTTAGARTTPRPRRETPPETTEEAEISLAPHPPTADVAPVDEPRTSSNGGWRRVEEQPRVAAPSAAKTSPASPEPEQPRTGGGWRRVDGKP